MTNSDALAKQIILENMGELLTVEKAAEVLNCSLGTIRNWIRQGRLPAYRLGPRLIRIKAEDLEKALRRYSRSKYD